MQPLHSSKIILFATTRLLKHRLLQTSTFKTNFSVSSVPDQFLMKLSFSSSCSVCTEASLHDADAEEVPV